ncbi:AraC family transcriptional regulator [Solimonas marina]|uniref:AraC family transcriptional regulator n=1 Tax=Solimonas marina TaxID=2714601 RepID=A0A970BAU9_9GAMM|nr:AraC family transcriptional regulator [Solimonas marina]NKF23751.1 AraC family transcriptional regulator [Solimonas marina]
MAENVYVSASLAELLRQYLDDEKLDIGGLRERLGTLAAQPRMAAETWWALLQQIADARPRPVTGLWIGRSARPHHVGVLGYLAMSCETLGQALLRFQRFQPLLHNLTPTLAQRRGDEFRLSWDASYARSTRLSDEVLVSALLTLARQLSGRGDLRLRAVEFPGEAPADLTPYTDFLQCAVHFGSHSLVVHLDAATLALPIDTRDPHLRALLDQQAEALLQTLPRVDALVGQLQQAIVQALQDGEPTLEQLARRMGQSSRTLYRQLQARGLTYKSMLADTRLALAQRYLADPKLSLPEIALLLGYSEQSAFTRAFKSWCGDTPLRYRRAGAALTPASPRDPAARKSLRPG